MFIAFEPQECRWHDAFQPLLTRLLVKTQGQWRWRILVDQQKPMFCTGVFGDVRTWRKKHVKTVGRFLKQNCDSTTWINELQKTKNSLNPFWLDLLLNSRTSKMLWTKTSIETGGFLLDLGKSSGVRIESSHFALWSYFFWELAKPLKGCV